MKTPTPQAPPLSPRERWLRRAFKAGVIVKGLDGALETASGVLFLVVSRPELQALVIALTRPELLEDPDDRVATWARHAFSHLSAGSKLFASLYLLVHGVIKLGLVVGLLREKLWAFPTALVFLAGFIAYQVYRVGVHYSSLLLLLTVFDLAIVALIWHEYAWLRRRARPAR